MDNLQQQIEDLRPQLAGLRLANRLFDAFTTKVPGMIASIQGLLETTGLLAATDGAFTAATAELTAGVSELRATYFDGQRAAVAAMGDSVHEIRRLNILLPLIALVISAIIASLVGIGISRLILRMAGAMTALAGGDTTLAVPALDRRDEIGRMAGAVQVFKENAIALIASEARFRDLLENLAEGVYQTTPDGHLLSANPAYAAMLGYESVAELLAGITDIPHQLYIAPEEHRTFLDALEARGRLTDHELRLRRRDGRVIIVSCSARLVRADGVIVRIEGTVADITARHEAEERIRTLNAELEDRVRQRTLDLEEALRSLRQAKDELVRSEKLAGLGALVAGIAHEVNTPIGTSVTVATTLQDKALRFRDAVDSGGLRRTVLNGFLNDLTEATGLMLHSLQQAASLIHNFKQVAVDQTSERRRSFDCRTVIGEVLSTLRPLVKHRAIRIEVDIPPGIILDSYPGALGQVLTNLVTNAVIHGFDGRESGTLRIVVTPAPASEPGETMILLTVADDGCGIPPALQPRVFDPFFTTRLGKGGSGLGLNLVYNIVSRILGGRIDFTSEIDRGTTFILTLPIKAPLR
ncbi:hypothetical protein CCP1ISM_710004 [Azospirillaceae bacterium]